MNKEEIRAAQAVPLTAEELSAAHRMVEHFRGPYQTFRETRENGYPNSKRSFADGNGHVLGTLSEGNFSKVRELVILANLTPKLLDLVRSLTAQRAEAVAECERLRQQEEATFEHVQGGDDV